MPPGQPPRRRSPPSSGILPDASETLRERVPRAVTRKHFTLRNFMIASAICILIVSVIFTVLAVNADSNAKANVTLAIAEAAVALTVIATLYQLVVSPGEQRRLRHTVRVEEGAGRR